jgi:hypothetical protein
MERLTKEQLDNMSKQELSQRFNLLIDRMTEVHEEVKSMPSYPRGFTALNGSESSNRFVRITDRLTRPFAASAYCDAGVKAIKL